MKVLVVSGAQKTAEAIESLLRSIFTGGGTESPPEVQHARSGAEARRTLLYGEFDLILINVPLGDEYGNELAVSLASSTTSAILLLVQANMAENLLYQMESCGVILVEKPIVRQIFTTILRLAMTTRRRLLTMKKDNLRLQQKIEEIRLIDRAKCVLIESLNMSEPQAHRYIEKQAMDLRTTKAEIAEEILRNYNSQENQ